MLLTSEEKAARFFTQIAAGSRIEKSSVIIVTHLLPTCFGILDGLSQFIRVAGVVPKGRSKDPSTLKTCQEKYKVLDLAREDFQDPKIIEEKLEEVIGEDKVILLDIGGYFKPCLHWLVERFPNRILGVIEDTENGVQKYENLQIEKGLPCPVISVARSPLKEPEDYMIGRSIFFSTEAILRSSVELMTGKEAIVFGYGKIGKSVANAFWNAQIRTSIVENDPIRAIQARSHGFRVLDKEKALTEGDIIIGATGNKCLKRNDFPRIKTGAFLASVTSADDEWEIDEYEKDCRTEGDAESLLKKYVDVNNQESYFYVLNNGNAVNFIHGAVCGNFIYLIQAEIINSVRLIEQVRGDNRLHGIEPDQNLEDNRKKIAEAWLNHFI